MPYLQTFPQELLLDIAWKLSTNDKGERTRSTLQDVAHLALTARVFAAISHEIIYSHPIIPPSCPEGSHVALFARTLFQNPALADQVRSIDIGALRMTSVDKEIFASFPNALRLVHGYTMDADPWQGQLRIDERVVRNFILRQTRNVNKASFRTFHINFNTLAYEPLTGFCERDLPSAEFPAFTNLRSLTLDKAMDPRFLGLPNLSNLKLNLGSRRRDYPGIHDIRQLLRYPRSEEVSSITSLTITCDLSALLLRVNTIFCNTYLAYLIRRMPRLKHFHLYLQASSESDERLDLGDRPDFSNFIKNLDATAGTLESIVIDDSDIGFDYVTTKLVLNTVVPMPVLDQLLKLKRIVCRPRVLFRQSLGHIMSVPFMRLPRSLETIELINPKMNDQDWYLGLQNYVAEGGFPNLKKVVIHGGEGEFQIESESAHTETLKIRPEFDKKGVEVVTLDNVHECVWRGNDGCGL